MKIVNITPGLIPIPPNGWGAVEKIIWEIHNNLNELGYTSSIKYLDDVSKDDDIVHIHVANLANMAYERGIPYYFTFHDHHAYVYGKDSELYKENLKAIKNAKKAFVPAKYLVDYFDGIPEYLSHGVNTGWFIPSQFKEHRLLCVANNGFAYNQSEDRKGFGLAIEAAQILGIPITIAGPSNNKNYFEKNPSNYDKLKILYDVDEDDLRQLYRNHSIFLHPSSVEAGHPNLTLLEAMASGLPVIGTYEKNNDLPGMIYVDRDINQIVDAIVTLLDIDTYHHYKELAVKEASNRSWKNVTKKLINYYLTNKSMKDILINAYSNTLINKKASLANKPKFNINFINGAYCEIIGGPDVTYNIKFINKKTGVVEHQGQMGRNCWIKATKAYCIEWLIEIFDGTNLYKYEFTPTEKNVYIALDSKALGDTIAWFPYVDEFRKKWNCNVICSTFHNNLFESEYPDIKFIKPGEVAHDLYAMYTIGWFHNADGTIDYYKNPYDFKLYPLQKTSSDILGIDFKEIMPKVKKQKNIEKENLITIGIHSTTQAKYWNNPNGWQKLVDYLKEKGYRVILLSKEENGYMGNWHPTGIEKLPAGPLENVIETIQKSKMFIGISSGLSWLSWVSETTTCIISGFTEPFVEPYENIIKINPKDNICKGCITHNKLDPGDWNWCPIHKGTDRQFECSKSIKAEEVIESIKSYL